MKRIVNSWDGSRTEIISNNNEDSITLNTIQDVEPYIRLNKNLRDAGDGYTPSRDMKRIGVYPAVIVEKILRETGVNLLTCQDQKALRRVLNEYPVFRASEGAI